MERIIVIGCAGSGKTTLSRHLSPLLQLPVVHLDKIYWKEGWQHLSKEEMDVALEKELEKPKWIIDGNFDRTLPRRLECCDTVIYLDYSRFTCLCGVIKRVLTNYGTVRPDMGEGCPECFDLEFLGWVWNFRKKNRDRYYEILKEAKDKNVLIFLSRKECRRFVDGMEMRKGM